MGECAYSWHSVSSLHRCLRKAGALLASEAGSVVGADRVSTCGCEAEDQGAECLQAPQPSCEPDDRAELGLALGCTPVGVSGLFFVVGLDPRVDSPVAGPR